MHKMDKIFEMREHLQRQLSEKFYDLHEEERLAFYRLKTCEPIALSLANVPPVQQSILKTYGFYHLSDVIAIGWHQDTFYYNKAKRLLLDIPGIGPKTVDGLMEKITSLLTTKEKRTKIKELLQESPAIEYDRDFFHQWSNRLSLQYEEIKQTVRNIRKEQGIVERSYKDRYLKFQKKENLEFKPTFKRGKQINHTYFNKQ